MEVKRRRKTCPMLAFSRFLPQKHSKREEGVCPVRGVVVSVCPSPPSPPPRPRWGKIKNDQKRFHSARKEQDSIHMGTHTFILTRVDGAGPTFRPPLEALRTSQSLTTHPRTNGEDEGSWATPDCCEISRKSAKWLIGCHNVTKMGSVCPFMWLRLLKIHRLTAVIPQWFSDVSSDTSCPSFVRLLLPFDPLV